MVGAGVFSLTSTEARTVGRLLYCVFAVHETVNLGLSSVRIADVDWQSRRRPVFGVVRFLKVERIDRIEINVIEWAVCADILWAVMPCLRALCRDISFPPAVRGPVLFRELLRLA